jgi:hypothetical protein
MAKFYGIIGYGDSIEDPAGSGVWIDDITEISYFGNVVRNTAKFDKGENLNNDISVGNSISVIADQYAIDHFFKIKYVSWVGVLWTVTNVEVQSPRLILSIGSVYNGPTA